MTAAIDAIKQTLEKDLEERLSIRIDFDRLEYSSFNSIRTLAEFMETMPSK